MNNISVREIRKEDIELIVNYWTTASPEHLTGMGVDLTKMLPAEGFRKMLNEQLEVPLEQKMVYVLIWLIDGKPAGHTNLNKIRFGEDAYMHLHLWQVENRKKGAGVELVKKSLPFFFENLQLRQLFCEPYALNPAPNKTLEKAGFEFEKEYITVPGIINFEQPVKRWKLNKEQYQQMVSL